MYNFSMDGAPPTATGPNLLVSQQDGVLRLTLNRPQKRNALSLELLRELNSSLQQISKDRAVRVVVIAAAGSTFCSGHDLAEMTGRSAADYHELFSTCATVMHGLRKLPQPVIARVNGLATAAGCQLVASCDLAVAATEAQFATPGIKIGLFCTTPMVPLVRAVPSKIALEMLFTGKPISADRALAAGLVNRVVPSDQIDAAIDEYCHAILDSSPEVLRLGKEAFYDQLSCDEATAYERAVEVITRNATQPDAQEGICAFLDKRSPRWTSD